MDDPGARPLPDLDDVDDLARELLRDLTPRAGNPEAVRALLLEHLDAEEFWTFAASLMRGLQIAFAECLTLVPLDGVPPGSLILTPPPTEETHR